MLPEPAATICAVAAYTGARAGEIQGLRWENWHDDALYIEQSVWNGIVGEPKTKRSKAPVPVIPRLASTLTRWRVQQGNPRKGWMFPTESGERSLRLNNILTRQIKPVLSRCGICLIAKRKHKPFEHEWERDQSLPLWSGWHAFRRGLASNLNRLKVDDSVIQRILRHSTLATTQNHYIKTVNADAIAAMDRLTDSLTCADGTPKASVLKSNRVH